MTEDPSNAGAIAAALTRADAHFATALCELIAEGRAAGTIDPETLALHLEFALRGCYFQADAATSEALSARAAALLEAAGGPTTLRIERGVPPAKPADEPERRGQTFTFR